MNHHLDMYKLMEIEQRGARVGCSGTMNNLLIDRMVTEDCHRGKRNLSMAWVDLAKEYDSIDHEWLDEMMILHRFPTGLKNVTSKLTASWNTKIQCKADKGSETSDVIRFRSGIPQDDALCPRLFTLSMNPVAWMLKATEGYKLLRPIGSKITDLLYIDDLKIFAASQTKLATVMKSTQTAMKDMGLRWNPKKCSLLQVKSSSGLQKKITTQSNCMNYLLSNRSSSRATIISSSGSWKTSNVCKQKVPKTALCDMVQPTIRCQQNHCIEPVCPPGVKLLDANTALPDEQAETN